MKLFSAHPKIHYNNLISRNIATRAMITTKILDKFKVFYPYTVTDGERPDTIAHDYYGNAEFDWLVLLSNGIIDPYQQWPKDQESFHNYLQQKYGYIDQLKTEICLYKYTGENAQRITWKITPQAFNAMSDVERFGWVPVYHYDHEFDMNEQKRNIRLLSDYYLPQVERELQVLFK